VKSQGLGGAFFWELSGDTGNGELINALGGGLSK
jgi:chitinase